MSVEYQPFSINEYPQPPLDLKEKVDQMESIIRFVDSRYPDGVFNDNDKLHTQRLVAIADLETIRGVDEFRLARELWVHDIPELITGDIVSPTKDLREKSGDTTFIDEEDSAAQEILSPDDLKLYRDFVLSGNFLKGKTDDISGISAEGLIAFVIDKIDGNMYFHYFLAAWFANDNGEPKDASEASLIYCFNQRNMFKKALVKAEDKFSEAVETCMSLLDYQIGFIVDAWNKVSPSNRPDVINQEFEALENQSL